jgi:thiol-disulfide isomerase/thioredoxin
MRTCVSKQIFQSGNMEPYFQELLARCTDRDILARACLALVKNNQFRASVAARPYFDHPEDHPESLTATLFLTERLDPDYILYFRTADVLALSAENEALLDRVVNEFGDVPQAPSWAVAEFKARFQGRTLGESAKVTLDALRSLAVGKVAPEIEGEDVDGKPMRLSDYRGKVVVLVFWGTWCGPCMRSLPMEKALAERLKDQPFALVGINSDADREKLKAAIVQNGITWRSWFDGGTATGPIANRWDVRGWPTIIVLDKEGVIRFKNVVHHTPKPLDDAVDSLLAVAKP